MDFDEESKNLRETFWMMFIFALLINLIAGIVIKIFEALTPETLKSVCVLIVLMMILLVFTIAIIYLILKKNIEDKGDIVVCLTHNKKDNNFVSFKNYFPSTDLHREILILVKNDFNYNSDLMDLKNKSIDEIFQYLILYLLNRMHTRWDLTSKIYSSENIRNNKKAFECVNPFDIDGFKSNSFVKEDEWLHNTKICLFKKVKIEFGIRSLVFRNKGIKLKISWHPAATSDLFFKILDPKYFMTYKFIVSYKLNVSPQAILPLSISSTTPTSKFYNWCKEVIERGKNELDWNLYTEKIRSESILLEYPIESQI